MSISPSRRRFLIGGASLAASAAAPIANAAGENPALVQAGKQVSSVASDYRRLSEFCAQARAAYDAAAPELPADLLSVWPDTTLDFHRIASKERAVDGTLVYQPNTVRDGKEYATPTRRVLSAKALREETEYYSARSKHGKELRRRLAIAEKYEAECERVKTETGIAEALDQRYFGAVELEKVVTQALSMKAVTAEGVAIKARALQALKTICWVDRAGAQERAFITSGQQLCSEIVSVFSGDNA